jgi:hypothetical protein
MLSISRACTAEDFTIGGELCKAFGAWDAEACRAYGISSEVVVAFFHSESDEALAAKYSPEDAPFLLARWHGEPAGCIALEPFDEIAAEIHKFYVASPFRDPASERHSCRQSLPRPAGGRDRCCWYIRPFT